MMLKGNKVYLRRLEEADLITTLKWINDPEIMIIMGVRGPRSYKQQREWYETINSSMTNIVFAICLVSDNRHIGNASLFNIDYIDSHAGITIFLGDEKDRGQRFGSEVVNLLVEYGFNYLNLNKVFCRTNMDKIEALKLYERLGFKREGLLRKHVYQYGEYVDKVVFGLLKSEYQNKTARMDRGI